MLGRPSNNKEIKIAPSENAYLNKYGHEEYSASNNSILELFAVKAICKVLHVGLVVYSYIFRHPVNENSTSTPHSVQIYLFSESDRNIYVFLRISKSICISKNLFLLKSPFSNGKYESLLWAVRNLTIFLCTVQYEKKTLFWAVPSS